MQADATLLAAQCVCAIAQWLCVHAIGDYYEKLGLTIIGKIYFWTFAICHDI